MVVKEFKKGNTIIRIHDDSVVKSPEEVKQILKRLGEIVRNTDDTENLQRVK